MEYQLLSIYKYNGSGQSKSVEEVEDEYKRRLNGYSSVVTNLYPTLDINDYEQSSKYPIFFVQTNEINSLVNHILHNSKEISSIAINLPGVARNSYTRQLLTKEIYFTNEIEGVKTNKKEIETIVGEVEDNKKTKKRLASTVRLYNMTINNKPSRIDELSDFRKIYDELLKGEINDSDLPDGELFRNEKDVFIGNELKKVHIPPKSETEIQTKLTSLIKLMNDDEITDVVKSLITHFMFENTHPFYDGNGRMGRYLLSSYLANKLDTYSGLSISGAIHAEQSSYYKTFKQADNFDNRADLTLFIKKMLEIIRHGQEDVIENLTMLSGKLKNALDICESTFEDNIERTVMYIFSQSDLFSESQDTGIKDTDLVNFLYDDDHKKFHKSLVRRTLKKLEDKNVLIKIKDKPAQHIINSDLINIR
ncbi:Fic family protein [Lentilactobacillus senioris]|uniref:Fic family protein n=1 Tax=Lentilactobacillus senioris TaxID=931534 RepID=UPI0022826BB6|nr:Fic family protein [Lentilactobacillus senioris]MCY9807439.1 Fic family protein [Lentilactobacillus senioris]